MSEAYIGLMSGTSFDGVDAVLTNGADNIMAKHYQPYPEALKKDLQILTTEAQCRLPELLALEAQITQCYIAAVAKLPPGAKAIGMHGQTIWHSGHKTWQLGNPNVLAAATNLPVVADFRRLDMAYGGQGAPLAPLFHQTFFPQAGVVINIGGIANMTLNQTPVLGFDMGPGNCLMDQWINFHQKQPFDPSGSWAQSGRINQDLLRKLLNDPLFKQPPPVSFGRENFTLAWLAQYIDPTLTPVDVQATLLALTAERVIQTIQYYHPTPTEIHLCGGGIHNLALIDYLKSNLPRHTLTSTPIEPDWVEAVLFAWLAKARLDNQVFDLSAITGNETPIKLGSIVEA